MAVGKRSSGVGGMGGFNLGGFLSGLKGLRDNFPITASIRNENFAARLGPDPNQEVIDAIRKQLDPAPQSIEVQDLGKNPNATTTDTSGVLRLGGQQVSPQQLMALQPSVMGAGILRGIP